MKVAAVRVALTLIVCGLGQVNSAQSLDSYHQSSQVAIAPNGIIHYKFEPQSQPFGPKLYNWRVRLNPSASKGTYDILQVTHNIASGQTQTRVLIPSDMVRSNAEGHIDFDLHIGDTEPTLNANGTGNLGHSILFSGNGTGTGASNAVILPGTSVKAVTPALKGIAMSTGQLRLIQFIVTNTEQETSVVEVLLKRQQ